MDINERVILAALYIIENKATIRQAAHQFEYGKSTLHTDVTSRLYYIDTKLHTEVRKILNRNYNEKHIRGGQSTRKKYLRKSK